MNFARKNDIQKGGFTGFLTISALQISRCCEVPKMPGVYLVLRPNTSPPNFLDRSTGGHYKGKNPKVRVRELDSKWIEGTLVLYIGKAGPGKATLRSRLNAYMRFGKGKRAGHWGGRYIWQLGQSGDLLMCWKVTSDEARAKPMESDLIRKFKKAHSKLPFANLKTPS